MVNFMLHVFSHNFFKKCFPGKTGSKIRWGNAKAYFLLSVQFLCLFLSSLEHMNIALENISSPCSHVTEAEGGGEKQWMLS